MKPKLTTTTIRAIGHATVTTIIFFVGLYAGAKRPVTVKEVPVEKVVTKVVKTKCEKPTPKPCSPRTVTKFKCNASVDKIKHDLWSCKAENNVLATRLYTARRMIKNYETDPAEYPEDLQWFIDNLDDPAATGKNPRKEEKNENWFGKWYDWDKEAE